MLPDYENATTPQLAYHGRAYHGRVCTTSLAKKSSLNCTKNSRKCSVFSKNFPPDFKSLFNYVLILFWRFAMQLTNIYENL